MGLFFEESVVPELKQISPKEMLVKTWCGLRPITEFDEIEIHEMGEGEDGELWQAVDCPGQPVVGFTVFMHCVQGGVETVQDFRFDPTEPGAAEPAKREAGMLGEQLRTMLLAAGVLRSIQTDDEDSRPDLRRQRIDADADRYLWLRDQGFRHADIGLGSDLEGENTVDVRINFSIPEPVGMSYEDEEWKLRDFDAAIDAARAKQQR